MLCLINLVQALACNCFMDGPGAYELPKVAKEHGILLPLDILHAQFHIQLQIMRFQFPYKETNRRTKP